MADQHAGTFSRWARRIRRLLGGGPLPEPDGRRGAAGAEGTAPAPSPIDARLQLESAARAQCQTAYVGDGVLLCRVLGRFLVYADAHDSSIVPHLCMNGFWEGWVTLALSRTIRPGWHCVDLGANHGYYSLLMGEAVGVEGRVLAVEPLPRAAELLRRTLLTNGLHDRVQVVQKAAHDTDGQTLPLAIPKGGLGMNASLCWPAGPGEPSFPVETVTVDALVRDWPRVDFIKVDVEGAEEAVWRGMRETARRNAGILVVMEFNAGRCRDARGFLDAIRAEGFRLRYIDYHGDVRDLPVEEALSRRPPEDWMLFLARARPRAQPANHADHFARRSRGSRRTKSADHADYEKRGPRITRITQTEARGSRGLCRTRPAGHADCAERGPRSRRIIRGFFQLVDEPLVFETREVAEVDQ
jgi:FkbM family methyltransferase